MDSQKSPRSLFFPLLLISAGVLIFLINIGKVNGTLWDNLLDYWPIILIIGGLDGLYKRDGWVGPLVLLGLGTILLLANLHYLPSGGLTLLLKMWPVLLVAIGLDILFGHRGSVWNNLFRIVLGLLMVAGIVWVAAFSPNFASAIKTVPFSQKLDQAKGSEIRFVVGASDLELSGGADKGFLVDGTASLPKEMDLSPQYTAPKNGISSLLVEGKDLVILPTGMTLVPWDFDLNSTIPIDLQADLGVGNLEVDLTETQVQNVETMLGVGKTVVIFPEGVDINAKISAAIGEIVIRVPKGAKVSIETDNALVGITLPDDYLRNGDQISSSVTGSNAANIRIETDLAIGSLVIEEID